MGPSLVGTAVEIVRPALGLLGPGRPKKKLFDPYPLYGKRVRSTWKANRPAQFCWERIGIVGTYPAT